MSQRCIDRGTSGKINDRTSRDGLPRYFSVEKARLQDTWLKTYGNVLNKLSVLIV